MITKYNLEVLERMARKGVRLDYAFEILGLTQYDITNLKPLPVPAERKIFGVILNAHEISACIARNEEIEFLIKETERILKIKPDFSVEKFNIYHPDVRDSIEEAFEVGLIKYYRFKSEFRLPTGRYKYHYKYLQQNAIRIDPETLKSDVQTARSWLTGERKKIDISKTLEILHGIETRASLPFDPELARKLAAVSFFTDEEDLSTFDEAYGDKKIKFWKENNFNDFFLMMPVEECLNLKGISITSLEAYLEEGQMIIQELTGVHPK
jgi:hypothetical protein